MGLIGEVSEVFNTIQMILNSLPVAIRFLGVASFGGLLFLAVLRSVRR